MLRKMLVEIRYEKKEAYRFWKILYILCVESM